MFHLISPDKLVIGKKYGIVCKGDVYVGPVTNYYIPFLVYDNIEEFEFHSPFIFKKYDLYEFITEYPNERWRDDL